MAHKTADTSPVALQRYLYGVDYPVRRDDLVSAAGKNGAPSDVMDVLRQMPDEEFDGPPAVQKAYAEVEGGSHHSHGHKGRSRTKE